MSMYYVTDNYLSDATITTSDDAAPDDTFGDTNYLFNERQSLPYRFTAKSDNWIKLDLGSAKTVKFIGLLNHNFDSGCTVTLRAAAADQGNLAAWQAGAAWSSAITYRSHNMGKWDFSQSFRWWHLEVDDAANANMPEIGEFVLESYSSFSMNYKWPFVQGMRRVMTDTETFFGQRWRSRHAKKKKFRIDFDAVTDTNLTSEVEAFFDALDGDNPFVFVPESGEAELYYVNLMNEEEIQRNFEDLAALSMELEEQTWGIRMLSL